MNSISNQRNQQRFTQQPNGANHVSEDRAPQLELGFESVRACSAAGRRQRRLNRARWWFQRMRQVVDRACDWQPTPMPRPEQIWFREVCLQPALAPRSSSEERQICE